MRTMLTLAVVCLASATARAALADPPERVGRVAYVEGGVALQPPGEEDWTDAFVNFPVAEGEGFWTGDQGRAELQIGGVAARLDSETELDVDALRWGDMRLALSQGSANIQVRGSPEGGVLVATPAGDVHLEGRGFYRIDVAAPDDSGAAAPAQVTVFQGQAEAPSPEGYAPIYPGQSATLYAGYDPQMQDAEDAAIDDWSRERIRAEYAPAGYGLPEAMSGAGDLARFGDYEQTPDFGLVWFPRDVPPDWAPYRFGRWVDVAPWGYTWVDEAPWGFAPFHYGRWADIDGRWAWVPGESVARPIYAPALVAFIGGGGWGAQFGYDGAIGWAPLGPGEVYRPTYAVSDEYLRRLNAANVRADLLEARLRADEAGERVEWRNARAATVVRADALARGAPVRQAALAIRPEAVLAAPPARAVLPPPPKASLIAPAPNRPPPQVRALRRAIAAPPPRIGAPPPGLAARRPAPPPPPQAGAPARLIAPAQRHNPAAQRRQPVVPPAGSSPPPRPRPPRPTADEGPSPPAPRAQTPRPPRPPPAPAAPAAPAPAPPEAPAAHEGGKPAASPAPLVKAVEPRASTDAQARADAETRARIEARREARRKAAAAAQASGQPPPPPEPPPP